MHRSSSFIIYYSIIFFLSKFIFLFVYRFNAVFQTLLYPISSSKLFENPSSTALELYTHKYTTNRQSRDTALVLYMFTQNESIRDFIVASTQSGSICVNDTLTQYIGKIRMSRSTYNFKLRLLNWVSIFFILYFFQTLGILNFFANRILHILIQSNLL